MIVKQNGKKRIATKTDTFKEWKSSVEQYTHQTVGPICETRSVAETTTLTGPSNETQSATTETTNGIHGETQSATTETTNGIHGDETTRPARDLISDQHVEISMPTTGNEEPEIIRMNLNQLADIMVNVEGQVDEIMSELREDPFLGDIMRNIDEEFETQIVDEGIEISPLDYLEFDVEPFDFEAEVENYEW